MLEKHPSLPSGVYYINPLNASAFPVFCDMESKDGIGVTVFGHDIKPRDSIHDYNAQDAYGHYTRDINYDNTIEQIVSVTDQSAYCEQFIKFECYQKELFRHGNGWWVSRQGNRMNYWGGAAVDSGKCACGMNNSCDFGLSCNCDARREYWAQDSGFLTNKTTLPVIQLRYIGIADMDDAGYGYYTLEKLLCW